LFEKIKQLEAGKQRMSEDAEAQVAKVRQSMEREIAEKDE